MYDQPFPSGWMYRRHSTRPEFRQVIAWTAPKQTALGNQTGVWYAGWQWAMATLETPVKIKEDV